ncbi:hypothetical protein I3842_04G147700 [Carya illinoinensis]|uniref:DUF4408 domain-containing protein n=1 Tax=Carya illinoinensis TaxID=32201 RepID=A0A922FEP1_CARIL|nr:hypothetical protein I3842_04G147700 [Carya illinoinensis]
MASWFTPMTSLFFLLNLTIFTIILTSRLGSQSKPEEQQHHHQIFLFRNFISLIL